ncbi:MAG: CtsR family transcriptional regulator [Firmicutes bacterium]|nr:CtsR family transcriptional regulator [Bacillota bacterium]
MAEKFRCAPSQINYVLETRFSQDHGFIIESRRGGGGFIRIIRLDSAESEPTDERFWQDLSQPMSFKKAEVILERLVDQGAISKREATLITRVLKEETEQIQTPFGDVVRSLIMRSVLFVVLNAKED